mmetsp:Transcript_73996/g.130709  ORF Transcript_73996/g.130709 Transcript_73996/m.130709 type:complete len:234 (+) Transcript_73996:95-796(+)
MNSCQGNVGGLGMSNCMMPALGYEGLAMGRSGSNMNAKFPLPTLLGAVRPPPGLEAFGPGSPLQLPLLKTGLPAQTRTDVFETGSQEGDPCRSDCSTADTSPALADTDIPSGPWPPRPVEEPTFVLELEKALPAQGCGTCPSVGSAGHAFGICKPCDFMYRTECRSGAACKFCHLCGPGENRRRKKQKQSMARAMKKAGSQQVASSSLPPQPLPSASSQSRLLLLQDLVLDAC